MRKVFGIVALSLGLLLVAAAALVSLVVAPKMTVLPADTNTLRVFAGNAAILANPTSLTGTTYGPGLMRNVPITLWHSDTVTRTSGSDALVVDKRSVHANGYTVADFTYRFGVDRTSMEASGDFRGVPAHEGLTFNWPIGTQKQDYTGWVVDTQSTTNLRYVGEGSRGGVDAYVFKTSLPPTTIRDPQLLAMLPSTMTKQQILDLTPSLQLTTDQLLKKQAVLDGLPDPVPMAYTYSVKATFWVAPDTGIVLDAAQHEVRASHFVDGDKLLPAATVMDMTYQATPSTLAAAAQDARDGAAKIHLIRTTVPWIALISGIVLTVVGIVLLAVRRRRPPVAPVAPVTAEPRVPVSVG